MDWRRWSKAKYVLLALAVIAISGVILHLMGQVTICKCGYVKLWHGVVFSSEKSQHLTDWYTPSHVIHGFGFYLIAWLLFRKRLPFGAWLLIAALAEASWEIFENTDMIINRYREVTISLDYYGDSVINSMADQLAMVAGFLMARKFPVWLSVALVILMEAVVGYSIRDTLALNIIMLI